MNIPYLKLTFSYEAQDRVAMPPYKGATIRGGFGTVFRRIVCAVRKNDCKDCLLRSRCVYSYVFETPPPEGASVLGMENYEKIPHPFVIEPPVDRKGVYAPGERIDFGMILVGRACDYLPYFIFTFDELGKTGIGRGRGTCILREVSAPGRAVYRAEEKIIHQAPVETLPLTVLDDDTETGSGLVSLRFVTPARIQYGRKLVSEIPFHVLIRAILRRLLLLYHFHCGGAAVGWNHQRLIGEAETVRTAHERTRWYDWERYSGKQKVSMKMGGIVGEVSYEGRLGPFMTFLKAGELLHVGKGTSFGLGKYEIQDSPTGTGSEKLL